MKRIFLFFIFFCTAILIIGCSSIQKTTTNPQNTIVSLGLLRLTSSAPLFIALEKGYFEEEGLQVNPQWFDAAQPIAVATASSKIDIGATGITASLFNMAAQGQKLNIVADKGREEKGFSSSALVVTTANYNEGITNIKSLKGKRIGITQKGSTFHYMLGRILEANDMTLNDLEIIPLGKVSAVLAALESKQIDGAILNEPNISKVQNAGYGKLLVQVGDIISYQTSAIFFSPNFSVQKTEARKFLKAYKKACNYYYDVAIEKKDPQKLTELIQIIAKYTNAPKEDIQPALPYIDRDGNLLANDIQSQIDWYKAHNLLEGNIQASEIIKTNF